MLVAYVSILITLWAFPFQVYDEDHEGCALCSSEQLTDSTPSGSTIRKRIRSYGTYGTMIRSNPQDDRLDLAMSPDVEMWAQSLIAEKEQANTLTIAYTVVLGFLPMPPMPTIALAIYLTYLRWWDKSINLLWQFGGRGISSCCRLAKPLPYPFASIVSVLLLYLLYRQASLLKICQLKRAQHRAALTRIEQLGEEKERLDYERALALRRLSPERAPRALLRSVDDHGVDDVEAGSKESEDAVGSRAVEVQLEEMMETPMETDDFSLHRSVASSSGISKFSSMASSEPELGAMSKVVDASKDPRRSGVVRLSEADQVGGETVATLSTVAPDAWSSLYATLPGAEFHAIDGSNGSNTPSVDQADAASTSTNGLTRNLVSKARDEALTRTLNAMSL